MTSLNPYDNPIGRVFLKGLEAEKNATEDPFVRTKELLRKMEEAGMPLSGTVVANMIHSEAMTMVLEQFERDLYPPTIVYRDGRCSDGEHRWVTPVEHYLDTERWYSPNLNRREEFSVEHVFCTSCGEKPK